MCAFSRTYVGHRVLPARVRLRRCRRSPQAASRTATQIPFSRTYWRTRPCKPHQSLRLPPLCSLVGTSSSACQDLRDRTAGATRQIHWCCKSTAEYVGVVVKSIGATYTKYYKNIQPMLHRRDLELAQKLIQ